MSTRSVAEIEREIEDKLPRFIPELWTELTLAVAREGQRKIALDLETANTHMVRPT